MLRDLARVTLGHWPTPLVPMENLTRRLGGPRLYLKRDDLTGLAFGGNKTRKLEYLLADALAQRATTLITTGAPQSNHARQTAAAAARCGLGCILVLRGGAPPQGAVGNLLLDRLLGARLRWAGDRDCFEVMEEEAAAERVAGRVPYIIPYGGSSAIGAAAYAVAMDEVTRQCLRLGLQVDHIVVASSSGGTQAGLVVGARANSFPGHVLGISVDPDGATLKRTVFDLALITAELLELRVEIDPARVQVNDAYLGGGYAVLDDAVREAVNLVARCEGLLLDPVYTGKAMAGLIDLIRKGEFRQDETVLFWHTGGTPALFAYGEPLLGREEPAKGR